MLVMVEFVCVCARIEYMRVQNRILLDRTKVNPIELMDRLEDTVGISV